MRETDRAARARRKTERAARAADTQEATAAAEEATIAALAAALVARQDADANAGDDDGVLPLVPFFRFVLCLDAASAHRTAGQAHRTAAGTGETERGRAHIAAAEAHEEASGDWAHAATACLDEDSIAAADMATEADRTGERARTATNDAIRATIAG